MFKTHQHLFVVFVWFRGLPRWESVYSSERSTFYYVYVGRALGGNGCLNDNTTRMSSTNRKDGATAAAAVGRRSGYTSLNLNQSYKGARPEGGKSYGKLVSAFVG